MASASSSTELALEPDAAPRAPAEARSPRPTSDIGSDASCNRRRSPRIKAKMSATSSPGSDDSVTLVAPPSIETQDQEGAFPPPKRLKRTRAAAAATPPTYWYDKHLGAPRRRRNNNANIDPKSSITH